MAKSYVGHTWEIERGNRIEGPEFNDLNGMMPHMAIVAPPGGGKGAGLEMPAILGDGLRDANIISIDPAAQNAAVTMRWRSTVSEVALLNPCHIEGLEVNGVKDMGINPLLRVKNVRHALAIGEALQQVRSTTEPFFEQSAQGLIAGVVLAVVRDAERRGAVPTLFDVRKILTGDLVAFADEMINSDDVEVASLLGSYNQTNRTIESIKKHAETATRFSLMEEMRRSLSVEKGIDWTRLKTGKKPLTVYVTIPDETLGEDGGEGLSPFLRLVVVDLINSVFAMKGTGRPTVLLLSEFHSLGKLKPVLRALARGRKVGLRVVLVLQNIPQLAEAWGPHGAKTIVGMCGSLVGFSPAPGDYETAEFLSKAGGMFASMRVNASDDPQGGPPRTTINEHEEKLWSPEKIRSLPEWHGLVWRMGKAAPQPVACPPYWELPEMQDVFGRPRYDRDPYHPGPYPVVFGKRRGKLSKLRAAVMVAAAVIAGGAWLTNATGGHLPSWPAPPWFTFSPVVRADPPQENPPHHKQPHARR
jgi:type IV secretory pathway TraG/TraD family ATPase VirD4